MQVKKLVEHCPACGETLVKSKNLVGRWSTWFSECPVPGCNTIVNTGFEPTDYQLDFTADPAIIIGYYGGYGAGKTASAAMKAFMHMISVPNGETIIGAASWDQMFKTNIKELAELIPAALIRPKSFSMSKTATGGRFQFQLRNGHTVYAKVFKSEGDLRSLNITGFWIEEASEVRYSVFSQLLARQRSDAGKTYLRDEDDQLIMESFTDNAGVLRTRPKEGSPNYLGVVSSNPDPGWIRTKFLYATDPAKVHYYGDDEKIGQSLSTNLGEKNPFFSAYVVPTTANYYLPTGFIEKNIFGKTKGWVDRYIKGSFGFHEGLVYPMFEDNLVEPFDVPKHWKHVISADFGRSDATAYLLGAIDPKTGVLYIYKEFYMPEGTINEWVDGFWELYKPVSPTAWLMPPIGDPAGQSRGQANPDSWFDVYARHGIYFIPSKTGKSSELGIAPGIALVDSYFTANKLKIFKTLTETIKEFSNYKYQTASLMEDEDLLKKSEKPVGGKDHLMDTLRGMISVLPRDPFMDLNKYQPNYVVAGSMIDTYFQKGNVNDPGSSSFWSKSAFGADKSDEYEDDYGLDWADEIEGDPYAF